MNKPLLTIYSPCYNRKNELEKLYESLCAQSCTDFIFLVADDGSSDGTGDMVNGWIDRSPFEVRYAYKENGGVHTARDMAYRLCDTELIVGIDSDDTVLPEFAQKVLELWNGRREGPYCGIIIPVFLGNSDQMGQEFPPLAESTYQYFRYKYGCCGDYILVLNSKLIKRVPDVPTFEGEKLVSEIWKIIQLPEYPFILSHQNLAIHNYLDGGYSKDIRKNWFKNIHGFREEYKMCALHIKYLIPRLKSILQYIVASLYIGDNSTIWCSHQPISTSFLFPIGFAVWLVTRLKWKRYRTEE